MSMALNHFSLRVPNNVNQSYFLVKFTVLQDNSYKIFIKYLLTYLQHRIREMKSETSNFVTNWLSMQEEVGFHLSANEGKKKPSPIHVMWCELRCTVVQKELQTKC